MFENDPITDPTLSPMQAALRRVDKLNSVLEVAKAMVAERQLDTLLPLILREAARVVDADRCSLFLLDREKGELWSRLAQKADRELRFPISQGLAGHVARTGEIINLLDAYQDARFNRAFDEANHYRTRSVLAVPTRDARGEITGVLQALNSSNGHFNSEDEELLLALGGQAAGAVENAVLHQEIQQLFEGFVKASVVAIEARDPTTSGHSERVAKLTLSLAMSTEKAPSGPYAGLRFSAEEHRELRYASLLHDFGKVGVREHVLVKANKLYPEQLELLKMRFELARKDAEVNLWKSRAEGIPIDEKFNQQIQMLDAAFQCVLQCNRPSLLPQGGFDQLRLLAQTPVFSNPLSPSFLLSEDELNVLSIPKGSLSPKEREEIESHVSHTFRFLSAIPWTKNLQGIPKIAHAHHEKLNATGYPLSLPADQIPVQSKIMAIADIYDALTASDRPYKKAVPKGIALDILQQEADANHIDKSLLKIFIEADVPKLAFAE